MQPARGRLAPNKLSGEKFMRHLARAVGFASILSFAIPPAGFAQTATGTQPGGTVPPAVVTPPGAGGPQQMAPSTNAKTTKQTAQQAKMKTCAHDAKTQGLKGDARKQFMSSCLKK
jgi:psiF repeat